MLHAHDASDFADQAGAAADVTVPGISVGADMDAFRRNKARMFLQGHANHIAVLKMKRAIDRREVGHPVFKKQ